jgi:hypothetical protein
LSTLGIAASITSRNIFGANAEKVQAKGDRHQESCEVKWPNKVRKSYPETLESAIASQAAVGFHSKKQ